jgi:excinuclease UvrABC nuclease subunit
MQRTDLAKYELPDVPGVYLFTQGKGRSKKVLYVGKATSLRDRVRSYFDIELIATRGPRIVDMVTQSDGLMHSKHWYVRRHLFVNMTRLPIRSAKMVSLFYTQ